MKQNDASLGGKLQQGGLQETQFSDAGLCKQ